MERMRIYFEYPLATEGNTKAVQEAINAGNDYEELLEMFDEDVLWDCVVVLSEKEDTPWCLFDHMDGNRQTSIEDWQSDYIEEYIYKCQENLLIEEK